MIKVGSHPYLLSLTISLFSLSACVDPITVEETETTAGTEPIGGEPSGDTTTILTDRVALLRVLPVDTSTDAEIFCTVVPVSDRVMITSASCFRAGIRYGEILNGREINFSLGEQRLAIVQRVYSHPEYLSTVPVNTGVDLAVIHVDRPLNMIPLTPFADPLTPSIQPLIRVGYLPNDDLTFRKEVSFGSSYAQEMSLLLFDEGNTSSPSCRVNGAPVLSTVNGQSSLIAISSFGDVSCTSGGSASLIQQSADFLNAAFREMITLPEGVNAQVQANLSCAQAFKCFNVSACINHLGEEAGQQYTAFFQCTQDKGCDNFSCYETECPDEFRACIGQ